VDDRTFGAPVDSDGDIERALDMVWAAIDQDPKVAAFQTDYIQTIEREEAAQGPQSPSRLAA